jgi:ABC-type Fe3+/spermidine/putrescine transport system ATPase subunit
MTRVVIDRLVKQFGSFRAIDGISLTIEPGELVVLLGPSGCGKTTTLRCVAGLEDVSGGEIRMGDDVVSSASGSLPPEKRAIGMVFQSYAVWPHMTVHENVAFGLRLKKLERREIEDRVTRVLDLVGLGGFGERDISKLSGGQQQRVALARAIVLEPRVLLFDEPLSNLDAKLREHMRFEIRELQQRLGITSLYVTHDQQEAMVIADRIVLMDHGRIDQIGGPQDIYRRPASRFGAEFVGLANVVAATVAAAGEVLTADGLRLSCSTEGFGAGDPVDLLMRPEDVAVSAQPLAGSNVVEAQVGRSYFLGNLADLYVKVGASEWRLQLSPPRLWPRGERVWLRVAPEDIRLFARKAG